MESGDVAGSRIADRLIRAEADAVVGRHRERTSLAELVRSSAAVVFVHGPGGIGKSVLVSAVLRDCGTPWVALDGRRVEPTPAAVLAALGEALGAAVDGLDEVGAAWAQGGPAVLVLDAYERFPVLDGWVRNELVPSLPASTTTVLVGRAPPNVAWRTAPGWRELLAELVVGPLSEADAATLVDRRRPEPSIAAKVLRFGGGHPLALELALDAVARHPDLELPDGPPPEVVEELLDVILDDLDPASRRVAEAASVLRRVTEPLLAAVLETNDLPPQPAWRVVRELPFASVQAAGLELNQVLQEVIAAGVELRDPGRSRSLRRRAARAALVEVERDPGWETTADLLHLVHNPVVRSAFLPPPGLQHPVERARPEDREAVLGLAQRFDGPAQSELLAHWWQLHPDAFHVLRGAVGEVRAFNVVRPADLVEADLAAGDPVTAAFFADLQRRPLPPGARALVHRRALAAEGGEALSKELAPMVVDMKRTYLELRPALQRVYVAVADWAPVASAMRAMGFRPTADVVTVAGHVWTICALDFGPGSVDAWLAGHVETETAAAAHAVPPPDHASDVEPGGSTPTSGSDDPVGGPAAAVAVLSAREREVLGALATGLTNRQLADVLFISERTANRHLSNIFTKLGVHNRTAAARAAIEAGLA